MDPIKPAYAGEAMLVRWSENHNGRTVTLQLDPTFGEHHPFKGLRGGLNGQRMQLAAVLIGDDEQPLAPTNTTSGPGSLGVSGEQSASPSPNIVTPLHISAGEGQDKPRTPFRDMPRSQQAALKCQDAEFQDWITGPIEYTELSPAQRASCREEDATDALKFKLGIQSRKELDVDGPKAIAFDRLLTDFSVRAQIR